MNSGADVGAPGAMRPRRTKRTTVKVDDIALSSSSSSSSSSSAGMERKEMTPESLKSMFHLPIKEAAKEAGIGLTRFKERCRQLGINSWPSRQLVSLQKNLDKINAAASKKGTLNLMEKERFDTEIDKIKEAMEEVREKAMSGEAEEEGGGGRDGTDGIQATTQAGVTQPQVISNNSSSSSGGGAERGDNADDQSVAGRDEEPRKKKAKKSASIPAVSSLYRATDRFVGELVGQSSKRYKDGRSDDTGAETMITTGQRGLSLPPRAPITTVIAAVSVGSDGGGGGHPYRASQTLLGVEKTSSQAARNRTISELRKGWFTDESELRELRIDDSVIDGLGNVRADTETKFDYFSTLKSSKRTVIGRALGDPREYVTYIPGTISIPPLPSSANIRQRNATLIVAEPLICSEKQIQSATFVPQFATRRL